MTDRHDKAMLASIRNRLDRLEASLTACHLPERDRADTLFSSALALWAWYGMHRRVGFSCSEWFDLEFPKVAHKASPLTTMGDLASELGVS